MNLPKDDVKSVLIGGGRVEKTLAVLLTVFLACSLWAFSGTYGGECSEELNAVMRVDGGFVAIGYVEHYDEPYLQVLAIKLDDNGEVLWAREYGTTDDEIGRALTVSPEGNYFLVAQSRRSNGNRGFLLIEVDNAGNLLRQNVLGKREEITPRNLISISDGFVIAGECRTAKNYFQGYVSKIDWSGNVVWERDFGGSDFDSALSVIEVEKGNLLVTGFSWQQDRQNLWLLMLDRDGNRVWDRHYGEHGPPFYEGWDITVATDGYVITGRSSQFSSRAYVLKVGPWGEPLWEFSLEESFPLALSIAPDGGYYAILLSYVTLSEEGFAFLRLDTEGNELDRRVFTVRELEAHSFAPACPGSFLVVGTIGDERYGRQAYWRLAGF